MLKQNWFANIACPSGFFSFCVFLLFYCFFFFAKIREGGPGPPGPSPRSATEYYHYYSLTHSLLPGSHDLLIYVFIYLFNDVKFLVPFLCFILSGFSYMLGRRSQRYSISSPRSFLILWCCDLSDRLFAQESKCLSRDKVRWPEENCVEIR